MAGIEHGTSGVDPNTRNPGVDPNTRNPGVDPNTRTPWVDPNTRTPWVDPNTRTPWVDPNIRNPWVDPNTGTSGVNPNTGTSGIDPNTNVVKVQPHFLAISKKDCEEERARGTTGKKRSNFDQHEKDILLELVNTLKVGETTVKDVLESEATSNQARKNIWAAVTPRWNKATGNHLGRKEVRNLYGRIKYGKIRQEAKHSGNPQASHFGIPEEDLGMEILETAPAWPEDDTDTEKNYSDNLTHRDKYRYRPILPKTTNTTTTQPNYQANGAAKVTYKKEAAASLLNEEKLKQMKTLAKFQKAEAKIKLNINFMKTRLLESQLRDKGISFELPFPKVEIPSSDESDDEEVTEYFHNNKIFRV